MAFSEAGGQVVCRRGGENRRPTRSKRNQMFSVKLHLSYDLLKTSHKVGTQPYKASFLVEYPEMCSIMEGK